jgi:Ni/Co efflux regulator RcnB
MKRILIAAAALSLLAGSVTAASAQNRPDDRHDNNNHGPSMAMHGPSHAAPSHADWHKGGHIARNDWNRGQRVTDWRSHHLNAPPRGYEWRRVDNNYVLAAATTGLIASIILASQ